MAIISPAIGVSRIGAAGDYSKANHGARQAAQKEKQRRRRFSPLRRLCLVLTLTDRLFLLRRPGAFAEAAEDRLAAHGVRTCDLARVGHGDLFALRRYL